MRERRADELGSRLRDCWIDVGGPHFSPSAGATSEELSEFERLHGLLLPDDLRGYLAIVNGMRELDADDHITSFWGLGRMKPVGDVYLLLSPHRCSRGDFVICDILIDSFWYAIRLDPIGRDVGSVVMWGVRNHPVIVARSFREFVEIYLADRASLPKGLPAIEDADVCPVHDLPMNRRRVGPWYGAAPKALLGVSEEAMRDFPYSGDGLWGGPQAPAKPRSWIEPVCDRCALARRDWIAGYGRTAGDPPT